MNHDLHFVPTDDLIRELTHRFDAGIFHAIQANAAGPGTSKGALQCWGDAYAAAGLALDAARQALERKDTTMTQVPVDWEPGEPLGDAEGENRP